MNETEGVSDQQAMQTTKQQQTKDAVVIYSPFVDCNQSTHVHTCFSKLTTVYQSLSAIHETGDSKNPFKIFLTLLWLEWWILVSQWTKMIVPSQAC